MTKKKERKNDKGKEKREKKKREKQSLLFLQKGRCLRVLPFSYVYFVTYFTKRFQIMFENSLSL